MSSILSQYFKGVTQQMRIQIDQINNLFNHNVFKGYENEALLRDFIKTFIPKRFGVGTEDVRKLVENRWRLQPRW